jgi:hypothetical protein
MADSKELTDLTYDEQTESYRYHYAADRSFCVDLVLAVSEVVDTDPTELEPLYNHIDPDLLEEFVDGRSRFSGDLLLDCCGVRIRIAENGDVVISPNGPGGPTGDACC